MVLVVPVLIVSGLYCSNFRHKRTFGIISVFRAMLFDSMFFASVVCGAILVATSHSVGPSYANAKGLYTVSPEIVLVSHYLL